MMKTLRSLTLAFTLSLGMMLALVGSNMATPEADAQPYGWMNCTSFPWPYNFSLCCWYPSSGGPGYCWIV